MNTYVITKQTLPINWNDVPAAAIDQFHWIGEAPVKAQAQLCCTEDALHIRLTAWEEHIRAEETGVLGAPHSDSCLEFFFCPVSGDQRYFNIECNPNGCLYIGMGFNRYDLVRLIQKEKLVVPVAERFDGGWTLEYSIPYRFIRQFFPEFKADSGVKIRGNFFKCGDETVKPHYITWNRIEIENPDFHRSDFFGELIFE